jgi:MoxR-like ATPase
MNELDNIVAVIEKLLAGGDSVQLPSDDKAIAPIIADLNKARTRLDLSQKRGIVVDVKPSTGMVTLRRMNKVQSGASTVATDRQAKAPTVLPTIKRHQHSYVVPKFAKDFLSVLTDMASHVVWITGPTQCGKDRVVHYAGRELGRKVVQINCHGTMSSGTIFGEKTIEIDKESMQNKIVFQKGMIEEALTEGLDENGNEVGAPAILFITEAASMPSRVAIALNRLLESDDARRTFVIDADGGRVVRGHSGMRIVFASNTVGRGATSLESSAYSAQTDALDISLLNRVAVFFRMGYDREVERHILSEKIGDDRISALVINFRDSIRKFIKDGRLTSPFSTAHIVHISDMYRVFGDIGKAIYYVMFESIMPEEKPIYNEQAKLYFGKDLLQMYSDANVDYM